MDDLLEERKERSYERLQKADEINNPTLEDDIEYAKRKYNKNEKK